jgi:hypothetical protein
MIQNVCLIIPPSLFLLDERVFMSLGILKVAAVLEQEGVGVELLDLSGVVNYEEALEAHVRQSQVECFGLTATTPQMPAATFWAVRMPHSSTPLPNVNENAVCWAGHRGRSNSSPPCSMSS